MALLKKIILENGIETNYHILAGLDYDKSNSNTVIEVHSFVSEDFYKKSLEKQQMTIKQQAYINEFNKLNNAEKTAEDEIRITELYTIINDLADKINNLHSYIEFVVKSTKMTISTDDFSIQHIEKLLLDTKEFKAAEIAD